MKIRTLVLAAAAVNITAAAVAEPNLVLHLVPDEHVIEVGGSVDWHLWAELNEPAGNILAAVSEISFSLDFGFGSDQVITLSNNAFQPAFDSTFFGPADDGTVINDTIVGASGINALPPLNNTCGPDSSNPLLIYSFTMTHIPFSGEGIFTPQLTIQGQMTGAYTGTPIPDDFFYQRADGTSEVPFSIEIGTVIIPAPTSGAVALIGLALIRRRSR